MIILIDIGNTKTKYCKVINGERTTPKSINNSQISNDYLSKYFVGAIKVIYASVSGQIETEKIEKWCQQHSIQYERIISSHTKDNIVTNYQIPSQLGIDRWLAILGASSVRPNNNVLIVDTGSATTYDLLTKNGIHLGGWILPGIDMLVTSLTTNTKQVKVTEIEKPSIDFGLNTTQNVYNAAWATTVGSINMAIEQSSAKGHPIDEIMITGGNSKKLASLLATKYTVIEDLVFIGLQTYIS